ncbi:MAG TPA: enoyl-CoA hydratase-related protein [Jatrophihabitans sp.]|jgi:enoyl-CoA hydratase/carnithine racemase
MTSSELVRTEIVDGIATITMADVGRRNSVTPDLSLAVEAASEALALNFDVKVAVLASATPAFSAGGDIDSLSKPSGQLGVLYKGFNAIAKLNVPTIAAVNGPAVGAGVNFALACDVIVAAESARFDPRFLDIGIHPGGGHLWRMNDRVGRQATVAMVIMGEALSGREAVERGLAWSCVPDDELTNEVNRLAKRAAGRSGELVRRTKSSLNAEAAITNLRDAADLEEVAQAWSMTRPAYKQGVAALQARLAARSK